MSHAAGIFQEMAGRLPDIVWRQALRSPTLAIADFCSGADLIVGSRTAINSSSEFFANADELVLATGAPVLLQPPGDAVPQSRRIIIGWKNKREARRAVWDSLPLLRAAEHVSLVRFYKPDDLDDSIDDVIARLGCHGVKAKAERRTRSPGLTVADDLIIASREDGADLIVTGAMVIRVSANLYWVELRGDCSQIVPIIYSLAISPPLLAISIRKLLSSRKILLVPSVAVQVCLSCLPFKLLS